MVEKMGFETQSVGPAGTIWNAFNVQQVKRKKMRCTRTMLMVLLARVTAVVTGKAATKKKKKIVTKKVKQKDQW